MTRLLLATVLLLAGCAHPSAYENPSPERIARYCQRREIQCVRQSLRHGKETKLSRRLFRACMDNSDYCIGQGSFDGLEADLAAR